MKLGGKKTSLLEVKGDEIFLLCSTSDVNKKITVHASSPQSMIKFLDVLARTFKTSISIQTFDYPREKKNLYNGLDWYDMPEFKPNPKIFTYPMVYINYNNKDVNCTKLLEILSNVLKITITPQTNTIWFPERPKNLSLNKNKIWITEQNIQPKYPIYIISKGRWEKRLTSKYLEKIGVPYKIVVEKSEYDKYAEHINKNKILILPAKYLNMKKKGLAGGGIPARNFVWDHAQKSGAKKHWILDDNIDGYYRYNDSERLKTYSGVVFRVIEDYTDRYTNIKMAGHNYSMFGASPNLMPITKNTRIYSSILLDNNIPYRWRGFYNEDTDLSLRILKDGYATALFNCFMADKETTLTNKGGNTDTIYAVKDAMYLKAKSLYDQHPDVVKIGTRFGRTHHIVNYTSFKKIPFMMKEGLKIPRRINNYTMKLIDKKI
jgi:hypothetical protein